MFNIKAFKDVVTSNGYTLDDIAKFLNINPSTLYRKMIGESDFYRSEIQILCKVLKIKDPREIFFAEEIA